MIALNAVLGFFLKIFRKIKRIIRRKILIITNPRPLLRKRLKNRQLIDELSGLMVGEKRTPPRLIWKVVIAEKSLSPTALQVFLNYPELSLNDIFDAAEDIPADLPQPKKEELENILRRKAKEIGLMAEDYFDIITEGLGNFREWAWNELGEEIKNGKTRKDRAKRILKRLMDEVPELRVPACELFMGLEPTSDELKKILDLPWMKFLPNFAGKIEIMIRKIHKREKAKKKFETAMEKRIIEILRKISRL
jgi:hypothetical protein